MLACLIVASELAFEFYTGGHKGFQNQMVTGFNYDLESSSDNEYHIKGEVGTRNPTFWIATFGRSVVELGVVVAGDH